MFSQTILNNKELEPIIPRTKTTHYLQQQLDLKDRLNTAKTLLDKHVTNVNFMKLWKDCDPYKFERDIIKQLTTSKYNISKAWMKCYEMLSLLNLPDIKSKELVHFDNASFPGSFILATEHYINTKTNLKHIWYASSLVEENKQTTDEKWTLSSKNALEDTYNLYKHYPERWLMNKEHNGDVLDIKNQLYICHKLGGKVDLYTSDLGFDVGDDYSNQESSHLPYNAGQILSGLLTLKKSGNMIIKQYTCFEILTVQLLYIMGSFFEELIMCKPATSRDINSEIYIIGKGFLGGVYLEHPYIQIIIEIMERKYKPDVPVLRVTEQLKGFYLNVIKASETVFTNQLQQIKILTITIEKALQDHKSSNLMERTEIVNYLSSKENEIEEWYRVQKLLPIY